GVWMFNIHASGGEEMMGETIQTLQAFCERENLIRPLVIGVTVLTSSDTNTLRETGIERTAEAQVLHLARLAAKCGLDGVVASPREAAAIKSAVGRAGFLVITPGVRPEFATNDDQKRVMTPRQATAEGSDYIVVGRPVLRAEDRLAALIKIREEIDAVEK
ncbi:MAG: orotidine-5'-phosphate decarboxylase, partial [Acidobacteriota bacterium]